MITLCIATDVPLIREGLLRVLDAERGILPSQLASHADDVLHLCRPGRPDVLLLDIDLPGEPTLPLLRRLRQCGYTSPVLLFGTWDPEKLESARTADVVGLLDRMDVGDTYARAVHAAAANEEFHSPRMQALPCTPADHDGTIAAALRLTPTERQVLHALAAGHTSREIAREMFISHRTVQKHRHNMARKLGLEGSNALLAFAVRHVRDGREPREIIG